MDEGIQGKECRGKCTGEVYGWGAWGHNTGSSTLGLFPLGELLTETHPPGPRLLAEAPPLS